jgi:hypothetical protein
MPNRCHSGKRADDLGVVSGRSSWNADRLQIRLRNELSPQAWRLLSAAASRAGTDVEGLLQQHLQEAQ